MTDPHDRPPADVIPPRGLTLDTLRQLDALAGQTVTVTEAGEVLTDLDGIPLAVGPTTSTQATFAGACVTLREVLAAGGDPDDFPNLTIVDTAKDN